MKTLKDLVDKIHKRCPEVTKDEIDNAIRGFLYHLHVKDQGVRVFWYPKLGKNQLTLQGRYYTFRRAKKLRKRRNGKAMKWVRKKQGIEVLPEKLTPLLLIDKLLNDK